MPRGKNMRKNKRNENALTTRLMQISLAMDDHIYSGKLITTSEAGGYLHEIASLKLRCLPTNVRALQVIEKLTRCMRSILSEDTEHAGNSFNAFRQMSCELAEPASPVYSLPDEDKTYTQDQNGDETVNNICNSGEVELSKKQNSFTCSSSERANIIKDSNCQNDMTPPPEAHNLSDPKPTVNDIPIIDITNTSDADEPKDIDAIFQEKNVSIENVNAEMFNMSIQDEISFQVPVGDRDCSQSILDNYDNETPNKEAREGTVVEKESYNKMDAKVHVTNNVNNYFAQHTPTSNTSRKLPSQPAEVVLNENNEPVKQTQPSLLKNKRKKVANKKDKKVTNKRNSKYTVDKNEQNYQQNVPNTMTSKYATHNDKENVPKTVKKKNPPNKKKTCGIYNKNVENDLSWVENIRYVREISPEEHDPALSLLPDNFWNNFALPDTWDDLDFEY